MIEKKDIEKHKLKTINKKSIIKEDKENIIKKLKELIPNIVNSDNQVNIQAITDLLDSKNTTCQ